MQGADTSWNEIAVDTVEAGSCSSDLTPILENSIGYTCSPIYMYIHTHTYIHIYKTHTQITNICMYIYDILEIYI